MFCPGCGKQNDDDSLFCRFCGEKFSDDNNDAGAMPENSAPVVSRHNSGGGKKLNNNMKIVLGVSAAVTALVVILIVLLSTGVFSGGGLKKEPITDAAGEEYREGIGTTKMTVEDIDGTVREIKTDRSLLAADSILSEYTVVMNKLKNDGVGFTQTRYQNLPAEHQNLGGLGGLVLPIIEKYVTSKTASSPVIYPAGNADKLPVVNSAYGCLLTDATKIKNAYCEIIDRNTYKLVITVVDEMNPEILPAGATATQSAVSGIFDPYDAAAQIKAISSLALSDIDFNYTDCTVTLIYNHSSKEVQTINYTQNIDINANAHIAQIKARIVDITEFTQFVY